MSRDIVDQAIHAAAANGIDVLLLVAGLVGAVAALISFLMIRQRPNPEDAPLNHCRQPPGQENHDPNGWEAVESA